MRKTLEVIGLGMLAVLYWITYAALRGPGPLPDRIPTHFGITGQPDAWGSTATLWLLPIIGTGLYLLLTVLASIRFRRFNLPVRVTESNLPFLQEKTSEIVAWLKLELLCFFVYIQWAMIQAARTRDFRLPVLLVPVLLVVIFSTVTWHLVAMIRGAKARAESTDRHGQIQNFS